MALLRENSLFGVLSLLTGQRSDRFYHAVAFTRVEMVTAPATSVKAAIEADTSVGLRLLQGLSSRILQTETMIETLTHRDMSSRLVSFLLVLCRDFGVADELGITIDLRLSHQAIAEAIGSTRVTITRLLGDLRQSGLVQIDRKKSPFWIRSRWPTLQLGLPSPDLCSHERLGTDSGSIGARWCAVDPGRPLGQPRRQSATEFVQHAPTAHRRFDHGVDRQPDQRTLTWPDASGEPAVAGGPV